MVRKRLPEMELAGHGAEVPLGMQSHVRVQSSRRHAKTRNDLEMLTGTDWALSKELLSSSEVPINASLVI